jgi:hypothetical protein
MSKSDLTNLRRESMGSMPTGNLKLVTLSEPMEDDLY